MVAARAELLGRRPPRARSPPLVVEAARSAAGAASGLVLDVGAGTGHYLAAVLDALPGPPRPGPRRVQGGGPAGRPGPSPGLGAVVADVWRRLPLADGCADLLLDVFAPRNGAEFHRVLRPGGTLLVVTPRRITWPSWSARSACSGSTRTRRSGSTAASGQWFEPVAVRRYTYPLGLSRDETARFVAMGPSAWHTEPAALAARLAEWTEPVQVTVSVTLRSYSPSRCRLDGFVSETRQPTGWCAVGEDVAVPRSVVGRVGRWCARHAWWVLAAWVVAVAAGVLATGPLFHRLADGGVPRDVESVAAYDVIRAGNDSAGTVVGVVDRVDPASPQVRDAVAAAAGRIANLDGVRQVDHPYQTATSSSLSIATDGPRCSSRSLSPAWTGPPATPRSPRSRPSCTR